MSMNMTELRKGRRPFIFIAGVEGTGHQWYSTLFRKCHQPKCSESHLGAYAWQRAAAAFNHTHVELDPTMARLAATSVAAEVLDAHAALHFINSVLPRDVEGVTYTKRKVTDMPWSDWCYGQYSYPNCMPRQPPFDKAIQMPDMKFMVEAIETGANAAAQLRVVLTLRNAAAIAASVCDHRVFGQQVGGCKNEMEMLIHGAEVMETQLDALPPPPLAVCEPFAFEDMEADKLSALKRLRTFIGLDHTVALAHHVNTDHNPRREEHLLLHRAELIARLSEAQGKAEAACRRQNAKAA